MHLWVEDFLALFTTVRAASIFVLLGVVSERTATRVIDFDAILYSVGGVVGTMHRLYFSSTPAVHMALVMVGGVAVVALASLALRAGRPGTGLLGLAAAALAAVAREARSIWDSSGGLERAD